MGTKEGGRCGSSDTYNIRNRDIKNSIIAPAGGRAGEFDARMSG